MLADRVANQPDPPNRGAFCRLGNYQFVCARSLYPASCQTGSHSQRRDQELFVFQERHLSGNRPDVSVFIPAQYDGSKPACVYVKTDGYNPSEKTLLETLIATQGDARDDRRVRQPGRLARTDEGHDGAPQSLFRIRRHGRQQRPLPGRGTVAVRGQEVRPETVHQRQRPLHRRRQQRRHRGFQCGLGTSRRLQPRLCQQRQLRRFSRRPRVSHAGPQVRGQADSRLSHHRHARHGKLRRRLVPARSGNGQGPAILGLRLLLPHHQRRPRRRLLRLLSGGDELSLEGLAAAGSSRAERAARARYHPSR